MHADPLHVRGAIALELAPGSAIARDALTPDVARALAASIAQDLAGFDAAATTLELTIVGAHYDPVQLLRPGWPIHRELDQLGARAPGERGTDHGRIIAFGAHEGVLPRVLAPDSAYAGGPLRLVPWLLSGPAGIASRVAETFERDLMERGMAGAGTALLAQEAFGARIEHARHLTLHDLCAMMALQYEHAGLGPLWPLLETALLSPDRETWLDAPPEPLVRYVGREVRIAMFSPDAWRARYAGDASAGDGGDEARLQRAFDRFEARQRQLSALLVAHGVPVTFAHCAGDPTQEL